MIEYAVSIKRTTPEMQKAKNGALFAMRGLDIQFPTVYGSDTDAMKVIAKNRIRAHLDTLVEKKMPIPLHSHYSPGIVNDSFIAHIEMGIQVTLNAYIQNELVERKMSRSELAKQVIVDPKSNTANFHRALRFKKDNSKTGGWFREQALKKLGKNVKLRVVIS